MTNSDSWNSLFGRRWDGDIMDMLQLASGSESHEAVTNNETWFCFFSRVRGSSSSSVVRVYDVLLCVVGVYDVLLCVVRVYYVLLCVVRVYDVLLCVVHVYDILLCVVRVYDALLCLVRVYDTLLCVVRVYDVFVNKTHSEEV